MAGTSCIREQYSDIFYATMRGGYLNIWDEEAWVEINNEMMVWGYDYGRHQAPRMPDEKIDQIVDATARSSFNSPQSLYCLWYAVIKASIDSILF